MIKKSIIYSIIIAFVFTLSGPMPQARAQILDLPAPGTMVNLSQSFAPAVLTGIKINPNNPLEFDFLIQPGDKPLSADAKREEYLKLVKYFLAALTTPEKDMWVNLSPYEGKRIVPNDFGSTEVGRDLLAQDYILKQLTASLIHPEKELGKKFWDSVYQRTKQQFGTTEVPVNTFNKIWIVPQKATVYENGHTALVIDSHLKVMLEEDYLAMSKHADVGVTEGGKMRVPSFSAPASAGFGEHAGETRGQDPNISALSSQVLRQIILPAIEKEVNEGANFAQLRQIYHAVILSAWFKKRLKESILGKVYVDKAKTNGIALDDPSDNQKIFQQYVRAYKKGVYNFIKEDINPATQQVVPRKYFSGGSFMGDSAQVTEYRTGPIPYEMRQSLERDPADMITVELARPSRAMISPKIVAAAAVLAGTLFAAVPLAGAKTPQSIQEPPVLRSGATFPDPIMPGVTIKQIDDFLVVTKIDGASEEITKQLQQIEEQLNKGVEFTDIYAGYSPPNTAFGERWIVLRSKMQDIENSLGENQSTLNVPKNILLMQETVQKAIKEAGSKQQAGNIKKALESIMRMNSAKIKGMIKALELSNTQLLKNYVDLTVRGILQEDLYLNNEKDLSSFIAFNTLILNASTESKAKERETLYLVNARMRDIQRDLKNGKDVNGKITDLSRFLQKSIGLKTAKLKKNTPRIIDGGTINTYITMEWGKDVQFHVYAIKILIQALEGKDEYKNLTSPQLAQTAFDGLDYQVPAGMAQEESANFAKELAAALRATAGDNTFDPKGQETLEYIAQKVEKLQADAYKNKAMATPGGIDMNAQLGIIDFQGQKVNFPVPAGFEYLLKEPVSGFTPRIKEINSGTWSNLPFFAEIRDAQPAVLARAR